VASYSEQLRFNAKLRSLVSSASNVSNPFSSLHPLCRKSGARRIEQSVRPGLLPLFGDIDTLSPQTPKWREPSVYSFVGESADFAQSPRFTP